MMNTDKYIEVIQRKVVKDMERASPNGGKFFSKTWLPAILQKSEKILKENRYKVEAYLTGSGIHSL